MLCKDCPLGPHNLEEYSCLISFSVQKTDDVDWRELNYHIKMINDEPHACFMNFYRLKDFLAQYEQYDKGYLHSNYKSEYKEMVDEIDEYTTIQETFASSIDLPESEKIFVEELQNKCEHKEITIDLDEKERCRFCGLTREINKWPEPAPGKVII